FLHVQPSPPSPVSPSLRLPVPPSFRLPLPPPPRPSRLPLPPSLCQPLPAPGVPPSLPKAPLHLPARRAALQQQGVMDLTGVNSKELRECQLIHGYHHNPVGIE